MIKQDPSNILQEHINIITIQQKLSELNKKTQTQTQIQGTKEELVWPDALYLHLETSSVSPPASNCSTANSIHSNTLSLKRQEAAEYAATQAALKIMAKREPPRETAKTFEAEEKLIAAEKEAAAITRNNSSSRKGRD